MYSGVRAWQCVKSAKKRTLTVSRFAYIYTHTQEVMCLCIYTREYYSVLLIKGVLGSLGSRFGVEDVVRYRWVVVKIRVPFWVP